MTELKLSMITDEVTQDLGEAIALAKRMHMQGVELRSVEDCTVGNIPLSKLQEYRTMLDDAGLLTVSLASPLCKCVLTKDALQTEMDRLKRLLDSCDVLSAPLIRAFAFVQQGEKPELQLLADVLRPFAELAYSRGKRLCFEADPSVNTTNHAQLAAVLSAIAHPGVGAIYDPGNCIWDRDQEIPYPNGFEAIKDHICHVHVKDAVKQGDQVDAVCIGTGLVNYSGLLKALKEQGYQGFYSMETHYRKASQLSEEMLQRPGGDAFSQGGMQAMEESVPAFVKLYADA